MLIPWDLSMSQETKWPLRVKHHVLVIFARVVLSRFGVGEQRPNALASFAVKSFLTASRDAAVDSTSSCKNLKPLN